MMYVFFTKNDWVSLFSSLMIETPYKFTCSGLFQDSNNLSIYYSFQDIPNIDFSIDNVAGNKAYLLTAVNEELYIRTVNQKNGETKYAIYPENNSSIVFRFGGLDDARTLLRGEIYTVGDSEFANSIFKQMVKVIKKQFQKINGIFIGNEAYNFLKSGLRLTANVKSPKEYDFRIS
jgi:hypothetical protein